MQHSQELVNMSIDDNERCRLTLLQVHIFIIIGIKEFIGNRSCNKIIKNLVSNNNQIAENFFPKQSRVCFYYNFTHYNQNNNIKIFINTKKL